MQVKAPALVVMSCVLLVACGGGNENELNGISSTPTDIPPPPGTGEEGLGLESSQGTFEPWLVTDANGNSTARPQNYDTAALAFRRVSFEPYTAECSSALAFAENDMGSYDVFLLTAEHCLYDVNQIGLYKTQPPAKGGKFKFKLSPKPVMNITATAFSSNWFWNGKGWQLRVTPKAWAKRPKMSNVRWETIGSSDRIYEIQPELQLGSDVVRLKLEGGLSLESAKAKALPICGLDAEQPAALWKPADSTSVRLVMGRNSIGDVVTHRLIGNIEGRSGTQPGRYGIDAQIMNFIDLTNEAALSLNLKSSNVFLKSQYAYSSSGLRVLSSDSGSPVIYGSQSRPSNVPNTHPEKYNLNSLNCISDVVTREFWSHQSSSSTAQSNMIFVTISKDKKQWQMR